MKPEVKDLISSLKKLPSEQVTAGQVKLLLDHIEELEEQQKLWLEPTEEMVQAGLAEVQRMLDDWDADGHITLGSCNDTVSDDQASDMAVFVLQAMAGAK